MCSLSIPIKMENYQGDLTDILRANASSTTPIASSSSMNSESWRFSSVKFSTIVEAMEEESEEELELDATRVDCFGDPFSSYIPDPLLHELTTSSTTPFFTSSSQEMNVLVGHQPHHHQGQLGQHHEIATKRPSCSNNNNNIFSRMVHISPGKRGGDVVNGGDSMAVSGGGVVGSSEMINVNSSSKGCSIENTGGVGLQISSPRNPGIKRRKSQAKKVVCIPAPAAANSRPTGEVAPSDLWAWRKYGQKPIKGSPYPRGYYRCSSSKGCSARKQVERSRTDPNMLVITYTSEHNHPWPTQRNALAGSTRSQPSKSASSAKASSSPHQKPNSPIKQEEHNVAPIEGIDNVTIGSSSKFKEEIDQGLEIIERLPIHDQGFLYRPLMPAEQSNNQSEDFFADLGEIEAVPLNFLFSQCFSAYEQQKGASKGANMDPFNLFDWSEDQTTTNTNNDEYDPSFGNEAKRSL